MWRDVRRESLRFRSGVVAGSGPAGTPVSARIFPRLDRRRRLLVIDDPYPVGPGPASILYHRHDSRLWNLRSCLITGTIATEHDQWVFRPDRFIHGMGIGGPVSYLRLLRNGRRTTSRYLKARGLPRPTPAWEEVTELLRRAEAAPSQAP